MATEDSRDVWLIPLNDGNRIDLTIQTIDVMGTAILADSLTRVVLPDIEVPDLSDVVSGGWLSLSPA